MQLIDYKQLLYEVSERIDEGVQIINSEGVTIIYNDKMAQLEKTKISDVLGAHFYEGYPEMVRGESTLLKALEENVSTIKRKQTYSNKFGKEISTINTTVPIVKKGKTIAALEIAKDITTLQQMSNTIIELQNEKIENNSSSGKGKIKKYNFNTLIGKEENFKRLIDKAKNIAANDYSVLIFGETGTGKELFSQSIHFASPRKNKPFLAQNCAALPEGLLESILFGTVRGSFTGAVDKAGLFEQASGGTLLLDEISAMPYSLQSKLLRVLQEKYIRRVGDTKDIPIDVRIIATSNEPLENLIQEGLFRKDLYYRLNTITLNLIPLRERKEDIPLLAEEFIRKHSKGRKITVSDQANEKLKSHDYFGNVRELENVIIAAVSMMGDDTIITEDYILFMPEAMPQELEECYKLKGATLPEKLESIENEIVKRVLKENNGNISRAAREMGVKRQTLQYKLRKIKKV